MKYRIKLVNIKDTYVKKLTKTEVKRSWPYAIYRAVRPSSATTYKDLAKAQRLLDDIIQVELQRSKDYPEYKRLSPFECFCIEAILD